MFDSAAREDALSGSITAPTRSDTRRHIFSHDLMLFYLTPAFRTKILQFVT
jgi:hypothetical protein